MYLEEEKSRLQAVVGWIVDVIVVLSLAWFLVFALGSQVTVSGQSMEPALMQDDLVLMNRLAYRFGEPGRYDIVVFEKEDGKQNMKRILGLPGETIQIREGILYVDGSPLDDAGELGRAALAGLAENPVTLGAKEYFLLGDNRENSEDSRFGNVGNVKASQIKGKIWFRIRPLQAMGFLSGTE